MKINKIDVSRGIQWVEIPEANLRILCGCPADAVKHLIKRGLIFSKEVNGVISETGPNAILLSDVLLQNGEFSNLAEFPVLQMLYKQGLMLPNHPNNTGQKPMLIGTTAQVHSQMRYIYRGNYGLVSREEMIQAGATEEEATEMMRLKLKFAFGTIRPSSDFLDSCIVNADCVEIANGVSLRRLKLNVFEITYRDEKVTVNINLKPTETYECAYPLGFRRFEPEYFAVIHSGEGDGWDANRPSMSSILTFQGGVYLIDAGPHLVNTMAALGIGIDQIDGIFHTHAHDDHFAGLTALMRAGRKIRYFATSLVRASVEKKLMALLGLNEGDFDNFFDVHDLIFDQWNDIDGLEVQPIFSPHPVETNIFVFRTLWEDGYRTYAHFADIASLNTLRGMVTDNPELPGLNIETYERIKASYLAPYNLKKIDIGGGMIHGDARDFRNDKSARILLAHRASELTPEEKEIGSNASFGSVDILIKGQSDGFRRHAFSHLEANFIGITRHDLKMLVNHPIIDVNPGTILIKNGNVPTEVLLLLSGQIEKLCTRDNFLGYLPTGAFIGSEAILGNHAVQYTYRAVSFVRVLRLPLKLYGEVIRRNGLFESVQNFVDMRCFLNTTRLFSTGLPIDVLNQIIHGIKERVFKAGTILEGNDIQVINILRSGLIERRVGDKVLDTLKPKDFFGEEFVILKSPSLFQLYVLEDTVVIQLPSHLVENVPILRWKIFDNYQKQVTRLLHNNDSTEIFVWKDAFVIHVSSMDEQHKRLIHIANRVVEHLHHNAEVEAISKAFNALVDYTHYHFTEEEKLLELYNYPEVGSQHKKHKRLIRQIMEYKDGIIAGDIPDAAEFLNFVEGWILQHIVDEDRKYGAFLNAKGVY
jgi:hemerythrin